MRGFVGGMGRTLATVGSMGCVGPINFGVGQKKMASIEILAWVKKFPWLKKKKKMVWIEIFSFFVIFKLLKQETTEFDVKASFARCPVSRLIKPVDMIQDF